LQEDYRATGSGGGLTFSGTVCDLEKPFIINGQSQLTFIFKFTPSSLTTGAVSVGGGGGGVTLHSVSGTYTVTGLDTDKPTIAPFRWKASRDPIRVSAPPRAAALGISIWSLSREMNTEAEHNQPRFAVWCRPDRSGSDDRTQTTKDIWCI